MQCLYIICGVPGSGKSTLGKLITSAIPDCLHFEADMYFINESTGEYQWDRTKLREAHQYCQDKTAEALRRGHSVVVSNTFVLQKDRKPYEEIACSLDIPVQTIFCQGSSQFKSIHNVPTETIQRMAQQFEYR